MPGKDRKTKFRIYATIDREEEFLNDMCRLGWKPVRIILGAWFVFERCEPGDYIVRVATGIDVRGSGRKRRQQLVELLTDSGAEIIPELNVDSGTRIYAVRKAELGDFEINTDIDSQISEYIARRRYHIICGVIALALFVMAVWLAVEMIRHPTVQPGEVNTLAILEAASAAMLLVCGLGVLIPVPSYTRRIRELRSRREIEE